MKLRKPTISLAVSILLILCACAPKAGTLQGKLVDENGEIPASEYTVLLCTLDLGTGNCRLNSRHQTTTLAGEFTLRDVPVGQYGVYIISDSTGIGTLLLRDSGQTLIIQLEEDQDFDLGTISLRPNAAQ